MLMMYRALIKIQKLTTQHLYVLIPAWNPNQTVAINWDEIPQHIQYVAGLAGKKFLHAKVNIAAPTSEDLVFEAWEDC
jgi:hypothetical protein